MDHGYSTSPSPELHKKDWIYRCSMTYYQFNKDIQPSAELTIFGVPGESISITNKIEHVSTA